jgi:lysozyme
MFDAMSDFIFNEGEGRLAASTLLRLVNQGDKEGAAGQFGRWIYAGKVVQPGLVLRRLVEKELFES